MWWPFTRTPKDVTGAVVVVTGGAMGIGRLLALRFAALGAIVVVWDLNADQGAAVVRELEALGAQARFDVMDVTKRELVYATAQAVIAQFGHVDILINNAGIVGGTPILESDDAVIERTVSVNMTSHMWTIKAFLPSMVARNRGNIVSISSAAGIFGCAGMVDYCASKAGAMGLMISLRQELGARRHDNGIHCTLVCPSFINTGMFDGVQPPMFTSLLSPEYAADQIVLAVRRDQWRLLMPRMIYVFEFLAAILPEPVVNAIERMSGVAHSLKHFKQTRPHAALAQEKKAN